MKRYFSGNVLLAALTIAFLFSAPASRAGAAGYPSSGTGRASVMIKIYCGYDSQYSAGLHSEGFLVSCYNECNSLV